ncbi:HEPN domain-containing protein [Sphingomonas gei]|uniref:HEPN domain-containing protein n=2 Tax=Sphingomonas gei TaxID=1395960 RepID=A0A4V6RBD5_9SPHN|nr:HEPN domain-containing protein [Sphingomonas gei]
MDEFGTAIARATQPHRRDGKIYKIILFGSYSRDDWVDEAENGYQSDYDLLVIVSHADLTDVADYWYVAEDKILRDPSIARPVNIIVHSLDEVNSALKRGEYFWVDIARDGIALYELPCHQLATPMPLTRADAYRIAQAYFDDWYPSANEFFDDFQSNLERGRLKKAAFELHQATERFYICYLLVQTLYFPRSHNIKFLRSLAEDKEPRLIDAWPRSTRLDRSRFERLKRAYVEARYSPSYAISGEDLTALAGCVASLRGIVEAVCRERLAALREAARE